jgi:hypothetical protein
LDLTFAMRTRCDTEANVKSTALTVWPSRAESDVIGSQKECSNCLFRPGPPAEWAGRWHIICKRLRPVRRWLGARLRRNRDL